MFLMAILTGLLLGMVTNRDVLSLSRLELKMVILPILAYVIQYGLDYSAATSWGESSIASGTTVASSTWLGWQGYVHIASYLLLFYWVYINIRLPGINIIALGLLLNFAVITSNSGYMPVDPRYLTSAALQELASGISGTHNLLSPQTSLALLADVIYLPQPMRELDSLGDLLLSAGGLWLIYRSMEFRKKKFS